MSIPVTKVDAFLNIARFASGDPFAVLLTRTDSPGGFMKARQCCTVEELADLLEAIGVHSSNIPELTKRAMAGENITERFAVPPEAFRLFE